MALTVRLGWFFFWCLLVKVMVADWFHEEVVVVAILKRQWRKMPRPQNLQGLYSVRFSWEHPGASLGAGTSSWMMLWIRGCCGSLWHLWTCHSCYVSVMSVQLRPLWPIMVHQQRWEPSAMRGCPGTAWQGSCHEWGWGDRTCLVGLPLSWPLSTPAGAPRAGLTPTLHCSSFPPVSEPAAFQPCFQHPLWIHSFPQTWDH